MHLIRSEGTRQSRRDRPRSDALVFRAAPPLSWSIGLKNVLNLSASSMPPLGFQRATHRTNIPHEHASYMNFTLQNEQNRRQGNVHRTRAGYPVLLMLMCSDGNCNHSNPFRNGRWRNQSASSAILLVRKSKSPLLPAALPCSRAPRLGSSVLFVLNAPFLFLVFV